DSLGGPSVVLEGEGSLGRPAAHPAAGAVTAGLEAVRVAESPHDEAARPHAARNDPELAQPGRDCPLPGDVEAGPFLDVVVMAVHGHEVSTERPREHGPDDLHDLGYHELSVPTRVALGPADRVEVVAEHRGPFVQPGEVAVRLDGAVELERLLLRALDEVRP